MGLTTLAAIRYPQHSLDTRNAGPLASTTPAVSAVVWPTANTAIYVPVIVPRRVVVVKLWYASSSPSTGNIDIGVYNAAGTRLVSSTSTAKVSNSEHVLDTTDTTIGPGLHYMALNCSNGTDGFDVFTITVPLCASHGVLTEAVGAVTLPATATWAVSQTLADYPLMGMLLDATVA